MTISVVAPSITTTVNDTLVLTIFGNAAYSTYSVPMGITSQFSLRSGSSMYASEMLGSFVKGSASATGDKNSTASSFSSDCAGQQIAIIGKGEQVISFPSIPAQLTTNNFGLSATATSGLAISYTVGSGPAAISNGTNLTFSGTGIVSVIASQAGNGSWNPAPDVTNTFNVTQATAQVFLQNLVQTYNGTVRALTATTMPAGLAVVFSYSGSATAPTNAGSYTVTGTVSDVMYRGAATGLLVVAKASQIITSQPIGDKITTNVVGLSATSSSGLGVSFVVGSGSATISGSTNLTFTGAGTVVIIAVQSGDANWTAAPNVTNTFSVTKAMALVSLNSLAQGYDGTPRIVTATTVPGGLPVSITYDGSATAPINAGSYVVTGMVSDVMYQGSQTGLLVVAKDSQTIIFLAIGDQFETNVVGLAATASSGLSVTFAVGEGPATITDGTNLTFTRAGIVSIVSSQGGDGNRGSAPNVTNTFRVYGIYSLQVVSLHGIPNPAVGVHIYAEGTVVTNSLSGSPSEIGGVTQRVCMGWALVGNAPASGTGTTFVATITNNATLTWLWQTNVWLSTSGRKHGSVEGVGWCVLATSTNITAVPDAGHQFTGWLGDVPVTQIHNNPLTLTMDRSRAVEATFFTEYHVAAAGGNDANSGLSMGAAKQTIQSALDETASGDTVLVSNGDYGSISVPDGVRVQSVNGAAETIIRGMAAGVRGAYLGSSTVLSGFAVTGAVTDVDGAGVYAEPGAQIDRCIIRGNTTSRDGGGVYGGSLTNCLLVGNSASNGAGAAKASLTYCTVAGNTAVDSGGGVQDCSLLNSIVNGNLPDNHIGSTANFSCAEPLLPGISNFTNDPYFVDVLIGDYRLSYTSPCLGEASGGVNVDLEGTPRPQPKVYGGASGYDMGCYEYYPKARFVWANGKGIPPYDSWANAATSIQAAVDNAAGGDLVMVEAGTYAPFSVSKAVTLMSLRGPTNTVIDGGGISRPITMTAPAVLDGFTVQNGAADDCGGILADNGATIRNVLIINNAAIAPGGVGGGMCLYNGSLAERVTVVSNQAQYGAGIYAISTSAVSSSMIAWNTSPSGEGGGVYLKDASTLMESTISSNSSARGGGVYADSSQVSNCTVHSNTASEYGGGVALIGGALNNSLVEGNKSWNGGGIYALNAFSHSCIVASNFAASRGGGVYLTGAGMACNLTVANNQATTAGGGVWINGSSKLWNSIVMYNSASNVVVGSGDIRFCCIDPLMAGQGNTSADPLFVATNDYHLRALSPCIDAGTNLAWMPGAKDIDRESRVWPDLPDMGADEAVIGAGGIGRDDGLYVKWNVVVGARLQIQTTPSLMEPSWVDFGGVVTASQASMTMSYTNDDPMGFFKMIWLKP